MMKNQNTRMLAVETVKEELYVSVICMTPSRVEKVFDGQVPRVAEQRQDPTRTTRRRLSRHQNEGARSGRVWNLVNSCVKGYMFAGDLPRP